MSFYFLFSTFLSQFCLQIIINKDDPSLAFVLFLVKRENFYKRRSFLRLFSLWEGREVPGRRREGVSAHAQWVRL